MDMIAERAFNWAYESKAYSESIRAELSDITLLGAWKEVFSDTLPACADKMLKIVDVGTGPGFFPIVLGQMGYPCIGADISPEMLAEASQNAAIAGAPQEFIQADADSLPFEAGSLDCMISRNVTWTLPDAEKTYRYWWSLLAPHGRLIIFDANWNRQFHDPELMAQVQADYLEYEKTYGVPAVHNTARQDAYRRNAPMCKVRRPQWDLEKLAQLNWTRLRCDFNITQKIWPKEKQIRFRSTPMFVIVCEK